MSVRIKYTHEHKHKHVGVKTDDWPPLLSSLSRAHALMGAFVVGGEGDWNAVVGVRYYKWDGMGGMVWVRWYG